MADKTSSKDADRRRELSRKGFERPKSGQEFGAWDDLIDNTKPLDKVGDYSDRLDDAEAEDSQVFFEMMKLLQSLYGWVMRHAVAVRSKPARDLLYEIQDLADYKMNNLDKVLSSKQ